MTEASPDMTGIVDMILTSLDIVAALDIVASSDTVDIVDMTVASPRIASALARD